MRYLSLFSGIEAASVAWEPLGWYPVAFSEVAPFPCRVLDIRFPDVPNLGDVKGVTVDALSNEIDLLVGGSPCQGFSIAGTRQGLYDERSCLAQEYVRVLGEFKPKWFIWENVPGALSTNGGADFAALIEAFEHLGYGVCWRVLDAKWFGVPQRRRRVFVVGYLGDWRPSAAVCFERESVRGTPAQGEGLPSRPSGAGVGGADVPFVLNDQGGSRIMCDDKTGLSPTLRAQSHDHEPCVVQSTFFRAAYDDWRTDTVAGSLCAHDGKDVPSTVVDEAERYVRKLTPVECERLQGFPDGWTDVPWRGKEHAPRNLRYQALGNSMAVPVMRWLGKRILTVRGLMDERADSVPA